MLSAEEAYREAERRIAAWREGEALDLAIEGLEEVPESIQALTGLQALRFTLWDNDLEDWVGAKNLKTLFPLSGLVALRECQEFRV